MLSDDSYELSNTIIHELTHATCFRSGDVEFNESLATFVGNEGALAFLAARFGPGSDELRAARDAIADEATFAAFVEGLYAKLDAVYRGPAPDVEKLAARERVFAQAKLDFEAVRAARMREPQLWGWFARKKLDNTTILSFRRYHMDLDAYADVLALCGGDFPTALAIYREAAASDDPRATLRTWSLFAAQVKVRDGAPKAAQEPLKKGVVPAAAVSPNKS
jgi:predicted aminopeptidase